MFAVSKRHCICAVRLATLRAESSFYPQEIRRAYMSTTKSKGPNKSEFVRRLLGRSPETNLKAVNAEWKKAGHTGSISNPLFYQIKSKTKSTSAKGSANGTSASTIIPKKPAEAKKKKGGPKKSAFVRQL